VLSVGRTHHYPLARKDGGNGVVETMRVQNRSPTISSLLAQSAFAWSASRA
jgi:hypothetical protein